MGVLVFDLLRERFNFELGKKYFFRDCVGFADWYGPVISLTEPVGRAGEVKKVDFGNQKREFGLIFKVFLGFFAGEDYVRAVFFS